MKLPLKYRDAHIKQLGDMGFRVSKGLPISEWNENDFDILRVAKRLMAVKLLFCYVSIPKDNLPTDRIQNCITVNKLGRYFTQSEKEMITQNRDDSHKANLDKVGWKLENILGLSYVMGFDRLSEMGLEMCGGDHARELIFNETPRIDGGLTDWLNGVHPRRFQEIVIAEDFYYCWHNATRNIAFSGLPNPVDLNPAILVGLIQERRMALTYSLSKCEWDDTGLST
jgi:hypothetical protein